MPINNGNLHWQLITIVISRDESKKTDVLVFNSKKDCKDIRKTCHTNSATGLRTSELECVFLEKFLKQLFEELDKTISPPLIKHIDSVQQVDNNCALHVLLNIKQCIEFLNEEFDFSVEEMARNWFHPDEATKLRSEIIEMLKDIPKTIDSYLLPALTKKKG